ncbi:MAG: ComEC/Rec2 family competence protein, partial [Patescibacteria group bacterium]
MLLTPQPRKISKLEWSVLAVLAASVVLSFIAVPALAGDGLLHVWFLDVGQGDAIFIQAPNGNQVLVDGGPDNKVLQELGRIMPFNDRSIDALVLSHPHADHLRGLIEVLKNYEVGKVLENKISCGSPECAEWDKTKQKSETVQAEAGQAIDLGGGVKLKVIYARQPDARANAAKNAHDYMLITKLEYGGESLLLTGDAEKKIEQILAASGDLRAQFLKVGHHGSKTSTTAQFLDTVKPELAFIELGARNQYGFPHPEVIKRLEDFGIKYYRTDMSGTVELVLDGRNYLIK